MRTRIVHDFLWFTATLCVTAFSAFAAPVQSETDTVATTNETLNARDPFWPIGYVPSRETEPEGIAPVKKRKPLIIKWPKLKATSTLKASDGRYYAIVQGVGVVNKDETISILKGGIRYRWKIQSIGRNKIVPKQLDALPESAKDTATKENP